MSVTPKSEKYGQGDCESPSPSPLAGSGPGGHKASFRGTKLARRARSFKEDFLEKISQMRSPGGGTGLRAHSPHSPKTRTIKGHSADNTDIPSAENNPSKQLDHQVRQVQVALKHFRDVVSKNKLEMLPGNGTIVLDTVTAIHTALKQCALHSTAGSQSTALDSATHQVYQSLARLIKLCDDVLLFGEQSSALDKENVGEVVTLVEDAVQNLVKLAQDKMTNRESTFKPLANPRTSFGSSQGVLEIPGQRNSLPDIPLTPRERQILEQTSGNSLVRNSHSSESILRDSSPPPKPPLPDNIWLTKTDSCGTPPPLPPKKKGTRTQQLLDECGSSDNSLLGCSLDRMSSRSRSPEDSSSLLSASAGSLDSVLNQSREEEEIRALMDQSLDDAVRPNDLSELMVQAANGTCSCNWDENVTNNHNTTVGTVNQSLEPFSLDTNRISNAEFGIGSLRSSIQSYSTSSASKRSSQQSSSSSQWSTCNTQTPNTTASNLFSQQNSITKSESIVQNLSSLEKSESIIENLSMKSESSKIGLQKVMKSETSVQSFVRTMTSTTTMSNISQISNISNLQMSLDTVDNATTNNTDDVAAPPVLPQKMRSLKIRRDRRPSEYDNVPSDLIGEHLVTCEMHQSQSAISTSSTVTGSLISSEGGSPETKPPPLPPKKKHMFQSVAYSVMAYMEMFGNCSHSAGSAEFLRHSIHAYNEWQSQNDPSMGGTVSNITQHSSLSSTQSCSFSISSSGTQGTLRSLTLPPGLTGPENSLPANVSAPPKSPILTPNNVTPPALPPKKSRLNSKTTSPPPPTISPSTIVLTDKTSPNNATVLQQTQPSITEVTKNINNNDNYKASPIITNINEVSVNKTPSVKTATEIVEDNESETETKELVEELDVSKYIVLKKPDEEGPEIRGGHPDALIIQATKPIKNEFLYQEAFLTTYRTFLSPLDLVSKLQRRHQTYCCHSDPQKQRAAKEAFSLLVRVVGDLTISDLDESLLQTLMNFVYQLVCSGDLTMAKALRVKILEKHNAKQLLLNSQPPYLSSLNIYSGNSNLLNFKSEHIAEQMTLLDADLFMKIEIPEVLIWAQEQNEERSPNLTCFTEHFNKMSYWARSRILLQNEAKEREKYVVKFIKIMKHLRKINNFNSYLALLSALDSAPIRRLEWQKHITEGLKEYCALIDSSSSFRAYRQALGETQPPCIPYIGLVLQDLTFVHIGNSDLLPDGGINFSKRWQQYNIVENMKRFKKGSYSFKKHDRIIAFFNNFDEFICEEAMWQISESIKPRGGKKPPQ